MRTVRIDPEIIRDLAAARGIDTARELAERAGISEWVLYKGLRNGHLRPSQALAIVKALKLSGPQDLARRAVAS